MNLERHPLSAAFPDLNDADLQALAADIAENGQREAVVLLDGKVLDGWNRTRACALAGEEPQTVDFPEDADPVAYVLSRNLHRRHMTESQRALAIVQCHQWANPGDNQHGGSAPGAQPATAAQMAQEAEVSTRTIVQAKAVEKGAAPEVKEAVAKGKISVKRGAEIAKLPKKEQVKAIDKKPAPKPPKKTTPAPAADDLPSSAELMADLEKELAETKAQLAAATVTDLAAEAAKQAKLLHHAQRRQGELMDSAAKGQKREQWLMNQLKRCGKAVGEEDPDKIAATVEAFVREHKPAKAA